MTRIYISPVGCGYGLPPAVGRRRSSGRWPSRDLPLVSLSKYPRAVCGGVGARGRRRQNVDQLGHAWCAQHASRSTAGPRTDGDRPSCLVTCRPGATRRPSSGSKHAPGGDGGGVVAVDAIRSSPPAATPGPVIRSARVSYCKCNAS